MTGPVGSARASLRGRQAKPPRSDPAPEAAAALAHCGNSGRGADRDNDGGGEKENTPLFSSFSFPLFFNNPFPPPSVSFFYLFFFSPQCDIVLLQTWYSICVIYPCISYTFTRFFSLVLISHSRLLMRCNVRGKSRGTKRICDW